MGSEVWRVSRAQVRVQVRTKSGVLGAGNVAYLSCTVVWSVKSTARIKRARGGGAFSLNDRPCGKEL